MKNLELSKASASMTMDDLKSDKSYAELAKKTFSSTIDTWELEANENIVRGYYAETVTLPTLSWAEINDKILKLIEVIRKKDANTNDSLGTIKERQTVLSAGWTRDRFKENLAFTDELK